jgi:hypothetical protein
MHPQPVSAYDLALLLRPPNLHWTPLGDLGVRDTFQKEERCTYSHQLKENVYLWSSIDVLTGTTTTRGFSLNVTATPSPSNTQKKGRQMLVFLRNLLTHQIFHVALLNPLL